MKIYKYDSYQDYVAAQIAANVKKINNIWVNEKTIQQIQQYKPHAAAILCHGTRNAAEQLLFQKYYSDATVIGTEISHTADQFPMTVQHDFHEPRDEWVGAFDIVYSNAWDHSFDPTRSLKTWVDQLRDNGYLFLEQATSDKDNRSRASDPLEIHHEEIVELVSCISAQIVTTYADLTGPTKKQPIRMYIISK